MTSDWTICGHASGRVHDIPNAAKNRLKADDRLDRVVGVNSTRHEGVNDANFYTFLAS